MTEPRVTIALTDAEVIHAHLKAYEATQNELGWEQTAARVRECASHLALQINLAEKQAADEAAQTTVTPRRTESVRADQVNVGDVVSDERHKPYRVTQVTLSNHQVLLYDGEKSWPYGRTEVIARHSQLASVPS